MRQTLFTLVFFFCAVFSSAQELKVKSFTHEEMDLEARIDGRTDLNGKQCALVKVVVRDDIVECKGGNVGDVTSKGVVKKIFVSPSARFLEFEFKYNFPLKVTFADYGYTTLSEGCTYTITLVDANSVSQDTTLQSPTKEKAHVTDTTSQHHDTPKANSQHSSSADVYDTCSLNGVTFSIYKTEDGIVVDNLGVTLRDVNDKEKTDFNLSCGVKVVNVNRGKFKECGIKKNYVLQKMNNIIICSIDDFVKTLKEACKSPEQPLFIQATVDKDSKRYFAISIK